MYENELYHHGILGQKWGKRNGPPYPLSDDIFTTESPKIKLKSGDYLYKKGTTVGHFGDYDTKYPIYLYTNQKDRGVYKDFRSGDHIFKLRNTVRVPDEVTTLLELYKFSGKNDLVMNHPYDYWKDTIDQGNYDFFRYMKLKGYDGVPDIRDMGLYSDDPLILFNPRKTLKEITK